MPPVPYEDKWLWKLAVASAVAFATTLLIMFKLNNLSSSFPWAAVFSVVWLGFVIWGWFIIKMIVDRAGRYKLRQGQVPTSSVVIFVNVVGWLGLAAFWILLAIDLSLGAGTISPPMLLLPLLIFFGILVFAPALPAIFYRDTIHYSLYANSMAPAPMVAMNMTPSSTGVYTPL